VRILVVGAGMYVTGRAATGPGTILAALAQSSREIAIEQVDVVARSTENAAVVAEAAQRINRAVGSRMKVNYHATSAITDYLEQSGKYDAAVIAVPDHEHHATGRAVLERGIHCLMVKPLTPTVAEARDLLRIQESKGLYAAVEFHKRFDESNRMVKRLIGDGAVGNVRYCVINYSQRIEIPLVAFRAWCAQTNIFQYLGVHYVDLVYFLTGARPVSVMAVETRGVLDALGVQTPDSVHALIQWRGGAGGENLFVTSMNIGWIDPRGTSALSDQKFSLVGSAGRLDVDQKDRGIELVRDSQGLQHINPYFSEFLPTLAGGLEFQGYGYKSIRGFLDDLQALQDGRVSLGELDRTRPSFRQAIVSTAVVEAVNMSMAQSSRWVVVHDAP